MRSSIHGGKGSLIGSLSKPAPREWSEFSLDLIKVAALVDTYALAKRD